MMVSMFSLYLRSDRELSILRLKQAMKEQLLSEVCILLYNIFLMRVDICWSGFPHPRVKNVYCYYYILFFSCNNKIDFENKTGTTVIDSRYIIVAFKLMPRRFLSATHLNSTLRFDSES